MSIDSSAAHGAAGSLFGELLLIFGAALICVALCRPLRLPGIFGYFAAGALVGPTGFGFVTSLEDIQHLADFGVVMLLFSLGLEFSLPRLLAMRRAVFGVGLVQVFGTGGLFALVLSVAGLEAGLAGIVGVSMALSSTAIVSRELTAAGQLHEPHGRQAIGVLLFQDIAAVALLILVPVFGVGEGGSGGLLARFAWLGAAGVGLFFGLMAVGRWLLPPLFSEIARSRSAELFVLAALVTVMTTAWLTQAVGLSMALGGFLGGMMLGESHFRHQIEADLRPFRDVLLGVFMISVGMTLDLPLLAEYWPRILSFAFIFMLVKGAVLVLIARTFGGNLRTSLRTALVLAQGGEFAFAVLALLSGADMLASDVIAFLATVTLVSMVVTPLLVRHSDKIADRFLGAAKEGEALVGDPAAALTDVAIEDAPVLVFGFGRVGQVVSRLLEQARVFHVAVESDVERVAEGRLAGSPVRYGDVTRRDLLGGLHLEQARLVVICIDPPEAALTALREVRALSTTVPVLVRTRDDGALEDYLKAGATEVVPETLESSLMLISHALVLLAQPRARIEETLESVRGDRYRLLHGVIPGEDGAGYEEIVHPVVLGERASACGRSGAAMVESFNSVSVRCVRRLDQTLEIEVIDAFQGGDVVVLVGPPDAVEAAEAKLLRG